MTQAGQYAELPSLARPPARVFVGGQGARLAPEGAPRLPGSKYYTLRYLLNALLAEGESVVHAPALSDDTAVLVRAMRALGAEARWERGSDDAWALHVRGCGGRPARPANGMIQAGNAGAALRLLLGIGALLPDVRFETNHPESLGRRPNADLLDALRALGLEVEAREPGGLPPITLRGGPPIGGAVSVSGARSSQYLSALLYLGPLLRDGLDITVTDGLRSAPLIRMSLRALAEAGVRVDASADLLRFTIPGGQRFQPREYRTPGDMPSTAALVAAARALDAPLRLAGLAPADEGARALVAALDTLDVPLAERPDEANGRTLATLGGARNTVAPVRELDCDPIIDSVPALVALACMTPGETRFINGANLRLKESDRIGDLCAELARAGADVTPLSDGVIARGQLDGIAGGVSVNAHDDHRLAQALAIIAIRSRAGLTIDGADAVAKSYPWFYDDLRRMGAQIEAR
ncbi:MAG TPA: 3-phosphoshikimate 1-carboxyvinyltransferase [Ktedonobacterales bacterium]|nr:3-phosphoshikimate 1-carboxyvinyltransferase [Ktedonobacterales bacterium]